MKFSSPNAAKALLGMAFAIFGLSHGALEASAASQDMTGKWLGVIQVSPNFIRIEINLSHDASGDGSLEGTIRLEPLVKNTSTPMGITAVTAHYDPQARTFEISPTRSAYGDLRGLRMHSLFGVFDAEKQAFGGVLVGVTSSNYSPYFVLARPENAKKLFSKTLKQVQKDAKPGAKLPSFGSGGKKSKILAWSSLLANEYPDIDFYHTSINSVVDMSRSLFRDEHFRPYFGKNFDKLSRGERNKIWKTAQKIPRPRANFPEERPAGVAASATRGFLASKAPDMTLTVLAFRYMDAWRIQSSARMAKLEPELNALITIDTLEKSEEKAFSKYWPSERASFKAAFGTARTRVVGPVLSEMVDNLVAAATSMEGAAALAGATRPGGAALQTGSQFTSSSTAGQARQTRSRRGVSAGVTRTAPVVSAGRPITGEYNIWSLMTLVDEPTKTRETAKLNSALVDILVEETSKDAQAINRFGTGTKSLQAGSEWNQQMAWKYGTYSQHASVRALFSALARQRDSVFPGAERDITSQLNSAGSTREIDQLRAAFLGVPSDSQSATGSRILRVAQTRRNSLAQQETIEQRKRMEEERLARSPCAKVPDERTADPGEPSGRTICRIIEAGYAAAEQYIDDAKGSCANVGPNDMAGGYACLMGYMADIGGGPQFAVSQFRKHGCISAESRGYRGYFCEYSMALRTSNVHTRGLFNALPASRYRSRFVLEPNGWYKID